MKYILSLTIAALIAFLVWPAKQVPNTFDSMRGKQANEEVPRPKGGGSEPTVELKNVAEVASARTLATPMVQSESPLANKLKQHEALASKVLRTDKENRQYHHDLSSLAMVQDSLGSLQAAVPEAIRMKATAYLMQSLDWKENPARAQVLDQVAEWLSQPPVIQNLSESQQRSLIADRVELFAALYDAAPTRGESLKQKSDSALNQRIMTYAYNFYIRDSKSK